MGQDHRTTPLAADIFILHGSFGSESRWYRPGGEFYQAVATEGATLGHSVSPFLWSGGITAQSIIEAAGTLVKRILELPPTSQIILFAHSNGGNVCAYASMLLGELYRNLDPKEQSLNILKKPFEEKKLTKNRNFIYEVEPKLDKLIDATFSDLQKTVDLKHYLRRTLPDYPIQLICLMGTPINIDRFDINMQVVKQVINLYSPADFIQALVGKQLLPEHERRANIQTKIYHSKNAKGPTDPCHKHIRNPVIGKWLLHLPTIIADKENATRLASGTTIFYDDVNKEPTFAAGVYSEASPPTNTEEDEFDAESISSFFDDMDEATSLAIE
jgi:hypothetical protein